jgi:5S rRNA maturation endonuclease (ribonuclease M5)
MVTGPKGGGQGLFGSNYLIQPKKYPAILVEGWADKIKMENVGYDNVMSIQTNKLSEDQFNFILSKGFEYIIVIPDNDSGGNVLINSFEKYLEYLPIYVGRIESKDPGEASEEELDFAMKNIEEWKPIVEDKEIEVEY